MAFFKRALSRVVLAGMLFHAASPGEGQECSPEERISRSDLVPVSLVSGGVFDGPEYQADIIWITAQNIGTRPTSTTPCERANLDVAPLLRTEWVRQVVVSFFSHDFAAAWMRCEPVQPGASVSLVTMVRSDPNRRCRKTLFRLDAWQSGIQFGCNVYDNDSGTFYFPHPDRLCSAVPRLVWGGVR